MNDIIRKLTSRKFITAVVGIVTGILLLCGVNENTTIQIGGIVLEGLSIGAYVIGEALVDSTRNNDWYDVPIDEWDEEVNDDDE